IVEHQAIANTINAQIAEPVGMHPVQESGRISPDDAKLSERAHIDQPDTLVNRAAFVGNRAVVQRTAPRAHVHPHCAKLGVNVMQRRPAGYLEMRSCEEVERYRS